MYSYSPTDELHIIKRTKYRQRKALPELTSKNERISILTETYRKNLDRTGMSISSKTGEAWSL